MMNLRKSLSNGLLWVALLDLASVPAFAATGGLDTVPGQPILPLAVNGTTVMTLNAPTATQPNGFVSFSGPIIEGSTTINTDGSFSVSPLALNVALTPNGLTNALTVNGSPVLSVMNEASAPTTNGLQITLMNTLGNAWLHPDGLSLIGNDGAGSVVTESYLANGQLVLGDKTDSGKGIFIWGGLAGQPGSEGQLTVQADATNGTYLSMAYGGNNIWAASANGNLGIATVTPQAKLDVNGTANIASTLTVNGELHANGWVQLGASSVPAGTNPPGGPLGGVNFLGTAANFLDTNLTPIGTIWAGGLQFANMFWATTASMQWYPGASGGWAAQGFMADGSVWFAHSKVTIATDGTITATNFVQPSDLRLKKNVRPIMNATDKISQINGVYFDWKEPEERDVGKKMALDVGVPQVGVIAQDVQKVLPEAVLSDGKSGALEVNATKIIPLLIEAVKENAEAVKKLEAENADLQQKIRKLEDR